MVPGVHGWFQEFMGGSRSSWVVPGVHGWNPHGFGDCVLNSKKRIPFQLKSEPPKMFKAYIYRMKYGSTIPNRCVLSQSTVRSHFSPIGVVSYPRFACADPNFDVSMNGQIRFMQQVVPWLESEDLIEKYAWFSCLTELSNLFGKKTLKKHCVLVFFNSTQ